MKLGTISKSKFALHGQGSSDWAIHSFTISPHSVSFSNIPDSSFSTPARYVGEIFARLCQLEDAGQEEAKFIFNPLFEADRFSMMLVLKTLRAVHFREIAVLVDSNNLPIGYHFPAWVKCTDSRFLTLLSAVNGETDAELLNQLFLTEVTCLRVDYLQLARRGHNKFFYEGISRTYQWGAERAIEILKSLPTASRGNMDTAEAKRRRDAIPFTAIMPYHAGDVLFFSIAFNNIKTHFSRIVVSQVYLDIVSDNAPLLTPLPINVPPNHRDEKYQQKGNATPDYIHFESFQDILPKDSFYYYCRPSRNYSATTFHLIDHFAFALGHRPGANEELLFNNNPSPNLYQPDAPANPVRVLLHFDGGWPLKIYPKELQEQLIDRLYAQGYAITVLASTIYEHQKCTVTTFRNYGQFVNLLKGQHILVGMDSFPCHYSAHVLGLPTICLFSSTRPANSNAPNAISYSYLEAGLRCCPCDAVVTCPLYKKNSCKNFVSPAKVADEIDKMIQAVRSGISGRRAAILPRQIDDGFSPADVENIQAAVQHIAMDRLDITIFMQGVLLPYFSKFFELYREFVVATKRDGMLSAAKRTIRFALRRFRGRTK